MEESLEVYICWWLEDRIKYCMVQSLIHCVGFSSRGTLFDWTIASNILFNRFCRVCVEITITEPYDAGHFPSGEETDSTILNEWSTYSREVLLFIFPQLTYISLWLNCVTFNFSSCGIIYSLRFTATRIESPTESVNESRSDEETIASLFCRRSYFHERPMPICCSRALYINCILSYTRQLPIDNKEQIFDLLCCYCRFDSWVYYSWFGKMLHIRSSLGCLLGWFQPLMEWSSVLYLDCQES